MTLALSCLALPFLVKAQTLLAATRVLSQTSTCFSFVAQKMALSAYCHLGCLHWVGDVMRAGGIVVLKKDFQSNLAILSVMSVKS